MSNKLVRIKNEIMRPFDTPRQFGTVPNLLEGFFDDRFSDYYEDRGDSFVLELELCGYKKEEVLVTTKDNELEISAKSKTNSDRHFCREISLPSGGLDIEKATAKLEDGVLVVVLPKSQAAQVRLIKVE